MEKIVIKIDRQKLIVILLLFFCLSLIGVIIFLLLGRQKVKPKISSKQEAATKTETGKPEKKILNIQPLSFNYMFGPVKLAGTIIKKTSPASYYCFKSKYPFNIYSSGKNSFEKDLKNVTELQLINQKRLNLNSYLNQKVEIEGDFMAAHTAHHHTDVLLDLKKIRPYEGLNEGTFKGFYTHYDKMDWGDVAVTCDAFTVINGTKNQIEYFKNKAEQGNTLNYLDYQNRLVINLNLDSVDSQTKRLITSSTSGSPVEIGIFRPDLEFGGVPACFSLIQILWTRPVGD